MRFPIFFLFLFWWSMMVEGRKGIGNKKALKEIISNSERIQRLDNLRQQFPFEPISMSLVKYRTLIYPPARNFTAFVLFHNGDQDFDKDQCPKCPVAVQMWKQLGNIHYNKEEWRKRGQQGTTKPLVDVNVVKNETEERCYFAIVKILQDDKVKVKVNVNYSEPNFYYFGVNIRNPSSNRFLRLNISQFTTDEGYPRSMSFQNLIDWVKETSGVLIDINTIPIKDHISKETYLMYGFGTMFMSFYVLWRFCNVERVLTSVWGFINRFNYPYWTVVLALWCVSGQMFNHIRGTGWAFRDQSGAINYISGSSGYQLITESLIVFTLYAGIVYSLIQLIQTADDLNQQKEIETVGESKVTSEYIGYYALLFFISLFGILYIVRMKQ